MSLTVHKLSQLSKIPISTLQRWAQEGYLTHRTEENGIRWYEDEDLERLQILLLFKELHIPLNKTRNILEKSSSEILEYQLLLLQEQKRRIENLIHFITIAKAMGLKWFSFDVFNFKEDISRFVDLNINSKEYKTLMKKVTDDNFGQGERMKKTFEEIFLSFSCNQGKDAESEEVQKLVQRFCDWITEFFMPCSAQMIFGYYAALDGEGEVAEIVDEIGGKGTAKFAAEAFFFRYIKDFVEEITPIIEKFKKIYGNDISSQKVLEAVNDMIVCMQKFWGKDNKNFANLAEEFIKESLLDSEQNDEKQVGEFIINAFRYHYVNIINKE